MSGKILSSVKVPRDVFRKSLVSSFLFFFILVSSPASWGQQIYVGPGAHLVMTGHPVLDVHNASLKNDGYLVADSGTIRITGDADTSIAYISGTSESRISHLLINKVTNGLALKSPVIVKDTASILQGILYSNGYLTLKSDAEHTATLVALPVDGSGNATAYVAGDVSIERYLEGRKAWRLLSAPIKNSGAVSSINTAWQEGATSGDPNPGYGIQIIGGSVANGYDPAPTANPSLKIYNNATDQFIALPPVPGTHAAISTHNGYFAFVWGNRSTDIFSSSPVATPTTLRIKGQVKAGDQGVPVNAFKYTVLGNPYPSAIDFGLLAKDNVRNAFYAWDPMLAGSYGVGGYVTVSWNGTDGYDVTGNVSDISQCIPSGAAVIIQSADSATAGAITIQESAKTFCSGQGMFARNGKQEQVSVLLYESNANGSRALMDAVLTTYADHHVNAKDPYDIKKLGAQYIGLKRGSNLFAIERRKAITVSDTIFLNLASLSQRNYQLNVVLSNMEHVGLQAILKDTYSAQLNNKLLNMNDSNVIGFQVTSNPASYAANRFSIVFMPLAPVPVSFTSVQASKVLNGITVKWAVENELNIKEYVLEKSLNGINFYDVHILPAKAGSGGTALYEYLDEAVVKGNNFYRVQSVAVGSNKAYSRIVKVNVEENATDVIVFPNPIKGDVIHLQVKNQPAGMYDFTLINTSGQKVYSSRSRVGSAQTFSLHLPGSLPAGVYQLETRTPANDKLVNRIMIQ